MIHRVGTVYQFGSFRLDPGEGTLSRDGERITVTPMVFSLLTLLVENHGRLLRREEIFAKLWEGVESHGNLDRRIYEVRGVLGPELSACLKTVPKRGYRLECPVSLISPEQERAPSKGLRVAARIAC